MQEILQKVPFEPQKLLNELKTSLNLSSIYEQKVRHYTLEKHTLLVMNGFEKYFSTTELPISKNLFRLMLALHDIGKPKAFNEGNKNNQYQYTVEMINSIRNNLPFQASEIDLIIVLVGTDVLGLYMQNLISIENAKQQIIKLAQQTNLPVSAFYKLMTVYYQCDIGSYTADAGGFAYLEHIFEYQNGSKVFDFNKQRLNFSHQFETKFVELEKTLLL
ncbi:HD domain-containing protein [Thermoflexibacter ruber]|uniref:HD domain-containing protein n=1 Tax=Thermoflexibacter ruber TaxID=1003 RepID=A0A1I2KFS2_9BACT|nr:hypothetical protein [Thermoflexibacter ruber]SFF64077.1 hypothetical protein SAMN04488541_11032 [Thermoflexibacter ruber]